MVGLEAGALAREQRTHAGQRLTQRLGRSYRFVEDTDSTHAHDVEVRAAQSFVTRAKDAVHHARRLFKSDGEQVHIG